MRGPRKCGGCFFRLQAVAARASLDVALMQEMVVVRLRTF